MASARELLEQADALMRRNRAGMIDTEVPELREVISTVALAPAAPPTVLEDVPELTEAVEEIEISSIVELPEDIDESSGWLHHDHGELKVVSTGPDSMIARFPRAANPTSRPCPPVPRWRSSRTSPSRRTRSRPPRPPRRPRRVVVCPRCPPSRCPGRGPVGRGAPARSRGPRSRRPCPSRRPLLHRTRLPRPSHSPAAPGTDEWARWEVLADEIRMQVLQRIDLFTEARLRDELSAHLQPIVDRASVEIVATINERVGGLIRAYIAEAIEREIEKWRGAAR